MQWEPTSKAKFEGSSLFWDLFQRLREIGVLIPGEIHGEI